EKEHIFLCEEDDTMYYTTVKTKRGIRYICTEDGPRNPVTGKRRQIRRRGKSKKEAKAKVDKVIDLLEGVVSVNERQMLKNTFEILAEKWLDFYAVNAGVKKNTIRKRSKEIKVLNRYIPKVPIGKITPLMYQEILTDLSKKDYAKNTISGIHCVANMIFKQAIVWKLLKDNPCQDATIPKKPKTIEDIEKESIDATIPKKPKTIEDIEKESIENKYFEDEELDAFLDAVDAFSLYNDRAIFYTLPFTGLRSGELCALLWSDLDFENNTLSVSKTIYTENDNMRVFDLTTPKTTTSVRTITVDPDIMEILKKHRTNQAKEKLKNADYYDERKFVIARPNGYPLFPYDICRHMKRILKNSTISKPLTPHGLRHTHISMLAEMGVDLKSIMERVGHKDMKTTIEIYTHVTNKMKKNTSQKVTHYLRNVLKREVAEVFATFFSFHL
ncbi:MAG: integrase family protein, partial [Bacillales bacterium]|nr:integrase family protein [Bacillales bacterium]